jgi:putative membrane protein
MHRRRCAAADLQRDFIVPASVLDADPSELDPGVETGAVVDGDGELAMGPWCGQMGVGGWIGMIAFWAVVVALVIWGVGRLFPAHNATDARGANHHHGDGGHSDTVPQQRVSEGSPER